MDHQKEEILCQKYPKIFKTAFTIPDGGYYCWGIDCGNGWFDIINSCCGLIQKHIDNSRRSRLNDLLYNRALRSALKGNTNGLFRWFGGPNFKFPDGWVEKRISEAIENKKFKEPTEVVPQVVAVQIKEKFGSLRFDYTGGDRYIDGIVAMLCAASSNICEVCGDQGQVRGLNGWLYASCESHAQSTNT